MRAIDADHLDFLPVRSGRRVADHVVPPGVLDVLLEFDAERAVVPEAVDAAVDFARRKMNPRLRQSDTSFSMSMIGDSFWFAIRTRLVLRARNVNGFLDYFGHLFRTTPALPTSIRMGSRFNSGTIAN